MAQNIVSEELQRVLVELEHEKDAKLFGNKLKHRFMPIIYEHSVLRSEFEYRVHFYEQLPSTPEFKSLLVKIHRAFKIFYQGVDPLKLPEGGELEKQYGISMRKFHSLLAETWKWPPFGMLDAHIGIGVMNENTPPWGETIWKYMLFQPFVFEAHKHKAFKDNTECVQLFDQILDDIAQLREMVEGPLYQLHLAAFDGISTWADRPDWIRQESQIPSLLRDARVVCEELIFHMNKVEAERKKKGSRKKLIRSVKNGIVTTVKGDDYSFKKGKSSSALLCEKVYAYCQQVGDTMSIEKVFPEVWNQRFSSDLVANRKKVYFACKSVNDWAKRKGLPPLLKYEKTQIMRCA
jgi:hypothetical protein